MRPSSVQPNTVKPIANFLRYWLPMLVWMALIFTASADRQSYQHSSLLFEPLLRWLFPGMSPMTVAALHHVLRKTCHLTEYAILTWLVWRAVRQPARNGSQFRLWRWDEAGLALAVVFAYAASDEFHQIFVPTRTPLVTDVLIDTAGGAVALLVLWVNTKLFNCPSEKVEEV